MLGRAARGGPSSTPTKPPPHAEGAAVRRTGGRTVVADAAQEVTVSQFVAQLGGSSPGRCVLADEAARRRLDSMHQRLRLLEQQMETLEAEVGKASSSTTTMAGTYA
ncbi:uncharacterized protein C2845_PM07G18530 [Panicum miliaceum]|uniref:Uncharacterized protein n=1 Tax=Panicum miliaceum TaxID=4540 RepID=A0A3L6SNU2_PANMI|nr:uncharacterized protein C2845_PM07G18530 [Panicum miliaceum]